MLSTPNGLVYSIQRYCIHDGPGIRSNVFFKGCSLFCPWCSNPESQVSRQEIGFVHSKCNGCGNCVVACPTGAILGPRGQIDRSKCNFCGKCVHDCFTEAYTIYGDVYTVDRLLAELEKDRAFYYQSGGGVTFSGGEPTDQLAFLESILCRCKEQGLHTALESHASYDWQRLERILPWVDLFLLDVKHMDDAKNKRTTGADYRVRENIQRLCQVGKKVALRLPIIPGYNDDVDNMATTVAFAQQLMATGNLDRVHLLPYHGFGQSKYESLSRDYAMTCPAPSIAEMQKLLELFAAANLPVQQGG